MVSVVLLRSKAAVLWAFSQKPQQNMRANVAWNEMPAVYFKQEGLNGTGSVQLCNVQNVSPDVTKEGTRVPFGKHKMPSRICVGLSYLISAAPSSFSIIRKWLLIRRRSILCQRVYKWPQHTLAASPPVMGLMGDMLTFFAIRCLWLTLHYLMPPKRRAEERFHPRLLQAKIAHYIPVETACSGNR